MTLEGAINFNETENHTIYTMNSATTGQYGVVMPKNIAGTLNMLVDLHMKSSFDAVGSGSKTKEELVSEINNEYNKLKTKYADGMLVIPMTDETMFTNAVANNDKQKMFDEVKKIGAITSELYKKLTDSGVEKQKIDQKIIIVEKNEDDEKFVTWLKEQMPNFVDGIRYSELTVEQPTTNPFVNNNDIFGPAPVAEPTPVVETPKEEVAQPNTNEPINFGNIFEQQTQEAPVAEPAPQVAPVVEPIVPTPEPTVEPTPVAEPQPENNTNIDIFGIPNDVQGAPVNVTPVAEPTPVAPVVAAPEVPAQPEPVPATPVVEPVPQVTQVVEAPKPVASAPLEGTITFNPITEQAMATPINSVAPQEENSEETATKHGSKGFGNLIILLVVLVGVTLASIELGKYLYSVYGA